jgi:hypothetical protein
MIIGKETITVLQEKPKSPPREGYIYLYSYNNLLWYMDFEGNEYCLPSSGNALISQLLSGSVYWDTGYTFNVSACLYMIRGVTYQSAAGTVTLDAADPSLDRIDVIYVDTDLAIGKITGTPSANPQKPMVNPLSTSLQAPQAPQSSMNRSTKRIWNGKHHGMRRLVVWLILRASSLPLLAPTASGQV